MSNQLAPEKSVVKEFYDHYGWEQDNSGHFRDALRFEDLRPVSAEYRRKCHLRINRFLKKNGTYLLDVASGPIQFPEYLTYSDGYKYRVCADISFTALSEAKKKLNKKGFYIQCDITRLPFKDNKMDGIVSLTTIFHVPAGEQLTAFQEIFRVLKPDRNAIVVYSWFSHSFFVKSAVIPIYAIKRIGKLFKTRPKEGESNDKPRLYFHVFDYKWMMKNLNPIINFDIFVWRTLSVPFMKLYIHKWLFGRALLKLCYHLEDKYPSLLGRIGTYPLLVLKK